MSEFNLFKFLIEQQQIYYSILHNLTVACLTLIPWTSCTGAPPCNVDVRSRLYSGPREGPIFSSEVLKVFYLPNVHCYGFPYPGDKILKLIESEIVTKHWCHHKIFEKDTDPFALLTIIHFMLGDFRLRR